MSRETRVAQLDTLIDEAVTAIGSSDWSGASSKLTQAEAIVAFIPDMNREANGIRYRQQAIKQLQDRITKKLSSGVVTIKSRHCRPSDGSPVLDCCGGSSW
jgi:hypothetical protein